MESIDKIFILRWIGPFFTLEELKEWEIENINCKNNLYILTGKEYRHRNVSDYVGITEQDYVYKRLGNNHGKFNKIDRELNIWVGNFSCRIMRILIIYPLVETLLILAGNPN